jgi:hypothetical protein
MRLRLVAAIAVALGLTTSWAAHARTTADDVELSLLLLTQRGELVVGAKKTTSPFKLQFEIGVDSGPVQTVTLRTELPAGLRWGDDGPDPSERCTGTAPAVCLQELQLGPAGTLGAGWVWDVIADRPGSYDVTASVQSERPDPNTSNNTQTLRFEIVASSGGGGGGGTVSVSAGRVKLTPARPKAGSVVVATSSVTADGDPVKPSKVACTGTLAGKKLSGKSSAATGKASCRYATPKSAKGKSLAGSMAITAKGKTITKRFSARLR